MGLCKLDKDLYSVVILSEEVTLDLSELEHNLSDQQRAYFQTFKSEKRQIEFLRTRWLVKEICGYNMPWTPSSEPRWPEGLKGSLAHKNGHICAVISKSKKILSLGVDLESLAGFKSHLAEKFMTVEENQKFTEGWEKALIFTVKEALFKAQFVLGKTFFGFQDAEVLNIEKTAAGFKGTVKNKVATSSVTAAGYISAFESFHSIAECNDILLTVVFLTV